MRRFSMLQSIIRLVSYRLVCLYCCISFLSCNDFLSEHSQDLYIPRTVDDYREFLVGEALNLDKGNGLVIGEYLDVLTDDVADKTNPRRKGARDGRETYWGYYTWQVDPELSLTQSVVHDNMWEVCYHRVFIANMVIDKLPSIEGTISDKNHLEAEARFIRAWSYFMLVNTYAEPYIDRTQAEATLSIPFNNATGIRNRLLEKVPLSQIYDSMETDLLRALELFRTKERDLSVFRPNKPATLLLLSRLALYTKQYQKVINWATHLIEEEGLSLYDLSTYNSKDNIRFIDVRNKEILFSYGSKDRYQLGRSIVSASNAQKGTYVVNPHLLSLYTAQDKRKDAFFRKVGTSYKPFKFYELGSKDILPYVFHLSEAYLNRAEAYAQLNKEAEALRDLHILRAKRISNYTPEVDDDVLSMVRLERRKELCFEGHRWFDLRRWGRPELRHTYSSSGGGIEAIEYVLEEGDKRYTLPIPREERLLNSK